MQKTTKKIYIGGTKLTMNVRKKQYIEDLHIGRTNNAIANHIEESIHRIDWKGISLYPKNIRRSRNKLT